VLLHLTEKLGSQFHCGGYHLGLEFVVTDFNFVGVDRILQERCKMHKKLVDFSHEDHWQVRDAIRIIAHPIFSFFYFQ
jgi:hypothetical protein